jgi:hypothetical protein
MNWLGLAAVSNARDEVPIAMKKNVSPRVLCRDPPHGTLIIADGYHRLCAVYSFDEDAMIPCQIV